VVTVAPLERPRGERLSWSMTMLLVMWRVRQGASWADAVAWTLAIARHLQSRN
jgi:hypothetical protein